MGRYEMLTFSCCGRTSLQLSMWNYYYERQVAKLIEEERKKEEKIKEEAEAEEALKQKAIETLRKAGVKFNPDDVIFATLDVSNQLIWLEEGNIQAGLEHILIRHAKDFANKHIVSKADIIGFLNDVIENGKLEYSVLSKRNGHLGYERLYSYRNDYIICGVGLNGFLASAYPLRVKKAKKQIEDYKNGKKEKKKEN